MYIRFVSLSLVSLCFFFLFTLVSLSYFYVLEQFQTFSEVQTWHGKVFRLLEVEEVPIVFWKDLEGDKLFDDLAIVSTALIAQLHLVVYPRPRGNFSFIKINIMYYFTRFEVSPPTSICIVEHRSQFSLTGLLFAHFSPSLTLSQFSFRRLKNAHTIPCTRIHGTLSTRTKSKYLIRRIQQASLSPKTSTFSLSFNLIVRRITSASLEVQQQPLISVPLDKC